MYREFWEKALGISDDFFSLFSPVENQKILRLILAEMIETALRFEASRPRPHKEIP